MDAKKANFSREGLLYSPFVLSKSLISLYFLCFVANEVGVSPNTFLNELVK